MFSEIEKEYRKGLQQKRFMAFYWPRAIVISFLLLLGGLMLGINHWIIYCGIVVILLILVIVFFVRDFYRANQTITTMRQSKGLSAKLKMYYADDDKRRIENLTASLSRNGINKKDDLSIMLAHYRSCLPINTKPNFLEWFLTTIVTLASVVLITYNDESGSLNIRQFETALVVAAFVATPIIIAKIVMVILEQMRTKLDTSLIDDLAYIYVHFDEQFSKS